MSSSARLRLVALVIGSWLLAGCGSSATAGNVARPLAGAGQHLARTSFSVPGSSVGSQSSGAVPSTLGASALRRGTTPPAGLGFTYARPGWVTTFRGRLSGVTSRIIVWLPPEYALPSYAHRTFPVVQLVGGYPAKLFEWVHSADVVGAYYKARAAGMPPAVLVATEINVQGNADLECLNAPGHAKVATWITRDVPAFIRAHFRVAAPGGWGIMGFSMGGYCAPYLALTVPHVYRAAVAINGYLVPTSRQLPTWFLDARSLLTVPRPKSQVSIRWTTTHGDSRSLLRWGYQLKAALGATTPVTVVQVPGIGHMTRAWSPYVWSDLLWLVPRLPTA